MIFELLENANDEKTVTVIIDNNTFNQILMMLVCGSYHMGLKENADLDNDHPEEN